MRWSDNGTVAILAGMKFKFHAGSAIGFHHRRGGESCRNGWGIHSNRFC
jgi:hypothetical protein